MPENPIHDGPVPEYSDFQILCDYSHVYEWDDNSQSVKFGSSADEIYVALRVQNVSNYDFYRYTTSAIYNATSAASWISCGWDEVCNHGWYTYPDDKCLKVSVTDNRTSDSRTGYVEIQAYIPELEYTYTESIRISQSAGSSPTPGEPGQTSSKWIDDVYAWLETSGGYSTLIAINSAVNKLNSSGLMVYKSGSSYYFTNYMGERKYVNPSASPNTYVYYSDIQSGDKNNGYQLKKATIYVKFRFDAF